MRREALQHKIAFVLRLILSPFIAIGMLTFLCLVKIIVAPFGILWIYSVAWVLVFKWVFKLLGIKSPDDTKEFTEISYMPFVLMFNSIVSFVRCGEFEPDTI